MQKSKKPRENQKKQKKQYSRTLGKGKMQKSKILEKTKKTKKKQKKQYSRTLVCRPHLQTSGILFFFVFLVFSRFFGFLHFYFCKSPGILFFLFFFVFSRFFGFLHFYFCKSPGILFFLFFFVFFGFLEVFLIFGFLLLQESWNIVFLWVFWFARGFLVCFL